MAMVDPGGPVRFGTFELDLDSGVLHRQGRRVPLQEQPARILGVLVSRPGEVVTREELRQLLWTDQTFVEFDASLNAAITKIRRALGDSAGAPRFIETLPKRGYRFLADVHAPQPASPSSPDEEAPQPSAKARRTHKTALLGIVAAALLSMWLLFPGAVGRPPAPLVRSLTVQPFEVRADDMHANLGSELAVAIGRRLGRLQTLTVKPWPPGANVDARAIGRELGVDARLSGVATRTGQQLSIALRLVSTGGDRALWEEVVNVPVTDLMWLESQIAQRVAAAVKVPLSGSERAALARHMTESLDAYQWFLRGRLHFERRTSGDLREAIAAFERATASDPSYALAYAWVANTYAPLSYLGFAPPSETGPALRAAAEKALSLDAGLAEAHLSLAMVLSFHERRWADAEPVFRRALELDPNYATGHHWFAFFLKHLGRFDEALEERRRALEIDPLTPMLNVGVAELHVARRQPDEAIAALGRTLERYPRFWYARLVRGHALEQLGRHREALEDYNEAERASPHNVVVIASVVSALAATGETREARARVADAERLSRTTFVPAFDMGLMRVAVGDVDLAFDWLQRSCDTKETRLAAIGFHPGVDRIRHDPRFAELLACVGLSKPFHSE